jgi:cephalosporin hydroxylase
MISQQKIIKHNLQIKYNNLKKSNCLNFFDEILWKYVNSNKKFFIDSETENKFLRTTYQLMYVNKINRFREFKDRQKELCEFTNDFSSLIYLNEIMSQGTNSVLKWKKLNLYKSCFDLAIYMQLLQDLKPDMIIEYGSGNGASALWMEDMLKSLKIKTKIFSYDIADIDIEDTEITFKKIDLTKKFPKITNKKIKKLVIEDAHVNVFNTLINTDKILNKDDYLIIEDSRSKINIINKFLNKSKNKYMVDTFYTDFFGKNTTSSVNSILKVM